MTEENTIQIGAEVRAANHAALAAFFEERSLVASQRFMEAVTELSLVKSENEELRASFADLSQSPEEDEYAAAMTNLKRVNVENEELRASLVLISKPRPQDEENNALADLLRAFLAAGIFTRAAINTLVQDAGRVVSPGDVIDNGDGEGGAN